MVTDEMEPAGWGLDAGRGQAAAPTMVRSAMPSKHTKGMEEHELPELR